MKKILIIGGTRFLGPELIHDLLIQRKNIEITVFNRGTNYGNVLPKAVKQIRGDRRDRATMNVLSEKAYDFIYDLCCFNTNDARNLLSYIKPTAHIIFLSTAAVYKKPNIYPCTEDSELGEWDDFGDYGTQKADAEKLFSSYVKKHNIKLTIFRPVYLLGKNNYYDRENYYFSRILNNKPILIPGSGNALIQFSFLKETANAFSIVPFVQKEQEEILNIGGNEYISVKNFVYLCANIVSKKPTIIELESKRLGLAEEHYNADIYPFPNSTLLVSNKKISERYQISFELLNAGMKEIYDDWKKHWDGKTNQYPLELKALRQFDFFDIKYRLKSYFTLF